MSRVRGLTWVGAWVLSRAVIVWLLLTAQSWVTGDLHYFADSRGCWLGCSATAGRTSA